MKDEIKKLNEKLDKVLENQQQILSLLNQNPKQKAKFKKETFNEGVLRHLDSPMFK